MLTSLMPLGDDNLDRVTLPYVTWLLIAANVVVFVFLQVPSRGFTYSYAVVPREIVQAHDYVGMYRGIPQGPGPSPIYLTILSAMFMHGSWLHLAGNMLYLWIFGDNVEDTIGHFKFLVFYLLCGLAATMAHILSDPNSMMPSLGASGAIAGVLGGYLVLFPTRSVRVLIGYLGIVEMPALIVIGFWMILQFMNGIGQIARTDQTSGAGVAYWAHIGGAVAGLLLIGLFRNDAARQRALQRQSYAPRRSFYN